MSHRAEETGRGRQEAPAPGAFAERLFREVRERQSALVVGLDPVLDRLPEELRREAVAGARGESAAPAERAAAAICRFLEGVLAAVSESAVAVKPNLAFFERYGAAGYSCLEEVCSLARGLGLLVIADAKRGDIGSTAEAYADALLGDLPGTLGPLVDAVTVNPYLGSDSLEPFLRRAKEGGRGVFVLVRTSNASAAEIQDLDCGGEALYLKVARLSG